MTQLQGGKQFENETNTFSSNLLHAVRNLHKTVFAYFFLNCLLLLSKWSCFFLFPKQGQRKLVSFPSSLPPPYYPMHPKTAKEITYRIQENGEKEFTSSDTFVQLLRTPGIFLVKYSMSEKATGLSREHLKTKQQHHCDINVFLQIYPSTFTVIPPATRTKLQPFPLCNLAFLWPLVHLLRSHCKLRQSCRCDF